MKAILNTISTGVANAQAWLVLLTQGQHHTHRQLEDLMSRFDDALAGHVAYENELKVQRDDLRRHLDEAVAINQQLRDTDAAEDAAQAAALEDQLAAKLEEALARAKDEPTVEQPAEPAQEPVPEPPADVPPADEAPAEPAPADEVPADPAPAEEPAPPADVPADPAPAEEAPAEPAPAEDAPADPAPADAPADGSLEEQAANSGDPFFQ